MPITAIFYLYNFILFIYFENLGQEDLGQLRLHSKFWANLGEAVSSKQNLAMLLLYHSLSQLFNSLFGVGSAGD